MRLREYLIFSEYKKDPKNGNYVAQVQLGIRFKNVFGKHTEVSLVQNATITQSEIIDGGPEGKIPQIKLAESATAIVRTLRIAAIIKHLTMINGNIETFNGIEVYYHRNKKYVKLTSEELGIAEFRPKS